MNYVNGRVMNRWPDGGEVYLSAGVDPSGSGTFHEGLNGWRAGSKFVFFCPGHTLSYIPGWQSSNIHGSQVPV